MKRFAGIVMIVGAMLLPATAAHGGPPVLPRSIKHHPLQRSHSLRPLAAGARLAPARAVDAPPEQVRSGAIRDASQLKEPAYVYPSDFTIGANQSLTPVDADDSNVNDYAYLHYEFNSQVGVHFSYKDSGALFGWYQFAYKKLQSGSVFGLEYVATAYVDPDAAVGAYNASVDYYTAVETHVSGGPTLATCSFSGADQCTQVTWPAALLLRGSLVNAVIRILQKSNSVWEGGYFLAQQDLSTNKSTADQTLDAMSSAYVTLVGGSSGSGPTSTPTPAPTLQLPSPTPTAASRPPTPTPTLRPPPTQAPTATPTATKPPTTRTVFNVIAVRVERYKAKPDWNLTRRPLDRVKPGTKVYLSVYYAVASAPARSTAKVEFTLKAGGRVVYYDSFAATITGASTWRSFTAYTLSKRGKFSIVARVTLNGKASSGSTSIAVGNPKPRVQAGPFTFSINRVFAQNAKGRPQSAFKVGQRVFVVADFTVRNLRSSLGASISVTFQARVGGGWKAVQPPNTYDLPAIRNGLNRYRQSFAIQSAAYSPLRILVGVTIASSYHQGMTTITVRK